MRIDSITDSWLRAQNWQELMGGKTQEDIWERRPGFVMRVTAGTDDEGRPRFTHTWCQIYRFEGRKGRLKLGRWPQMGHESARKQADRALGKLANGIDPAAERRAQREREREIENVVMVDGMAERFLNEYRTRKREKWRPSTEHTNRLMMKSEVLPQLGWLPAERVTSAHIEDLLEAITKREKKGNRGNGVRANRVQVLISGMFRWAKKKGLVDTNPAMGIERLGAEKARERNLSRSEIKKLWLTLGEGDTADQYRFMLATAQRVGECAKLEWQDIDLDAKWWTIPSDKSKNHLAHRVPLGPIAMEILIRRGPKESGFVFPHAALHRSIPTWRHEKIEKACGFVQPWQPRDLRRTAASEISPKFGSSKVAVLLNHRDSTTPAVTRVYDRAEQDPNKREMAEWWNQRLLSIVASSVVELRSAVDAAAS
jgi:integrase